MKLKSLAALVLAASSTASFAGDWFIDSNPNSVLNLLVGSFELSGTSHVSLSFDGFASNSGRYALVAPLTVSLTPSATAAASLTGSSVSGYLLDDPDAAAGALHHYTVSFSSLAAGSYTVRLTGDDGNKRVAFTSFNSSISPVPEPETYALMLAGLAAVGALVRRQRHAA